MCDHLPPCPPASAPDHAAARVVSEHHEQGWVRLCNGVIVFDDLGELVPDPSPQDDLPGATVLAYRARPVERGRGWHRAAVGASSSAAHLAPAS